MSTTDFVLKRVEVNHFPCTIGFGFSFSKDLFFRHPSSRDKVTWVSLNVMFVFWNVTFRYPFKIWGIRK